MQKNKDSSYPRKILMDGIGFERSPLSTNKKCVAVRDVLTSYCARRTLYGPTQRCNTLGDCFGGIGACV